MGRPDAVTAWGTVDPGRLFGRRLKDSNGLVSSVEAGRGSYLGADDDDDDHGTASTDMLIEWIEGEYDERKSTIILRGSNGFALTVGHSSCRRLCWKRLAHQPPAEDDRSVSVSVLGNRKHRTRFKGRHSCIY